MPLQYANPCRVCGQPYLHGSETTCQDCMRRRENNDQTRSRRQRRLRCDCGKRAQVVIWVQVGLREDGIHAERLALCPRCLEVEKQTQAMLDRLGYGWRD